METLVLSIPPVKISIKLAISIGIGILVGFEREWAQKDLRARTFTIVTISGAISILAAPSIAVITFIGVLFIVVLTGLPNLSESKPVEATTSAAVIVVFVFGHPGRRRKSLHSLRNRHSDDVVVAQTRTCPLRGRPSGY